MTGLQIISHFLPFFWPKNDLKKKFRIILSLFLVVTTLALNLIVPIIFKDIVTELSGTIASSSSVIMLLICGYGLLWTLSRCSEKIREMVTFSNISTTIADYSTHVFAHLHALNYQFHMDKETGKVTSAISRSQLAIAMLISNILFRIAPVLIEILCAFLIIWYLYGLSYGLSLMIILSLYLIFNGLTQKKSKTLQRNSSNAELNVSSAIADSLLNTETVKYYNNQFAEYQKIDRFLQESAKANIALFSGMGLFLILQTLIIAAGLAFLSYKVGYQILIGHLKVGDFVLINGYLLQLFEPLNNASVLWRDTKNDLSKIEYSAYLLEQTDEVEQDKPDAKPLIISRPDIRFQNVTFGYKRNQPILKNISFEAPSQKMTAIVGPSGSGKSTIARLMLGLFEASQGQIFIDDQDIHSVTKYSLRQHIGVVPQEVLLFNNTLKFNLCYGSPNISDHEINTVIQLTHLEELVKNLPQGLETNIGEGGFKLSGGERQRIGIARCLLRKPSILLFDEATASLDTQTEKSIQENIEEITKHTTSIVIAHRLSTIIHADNILVIKNGEIVEYGKHQELVKKNGVYSSMWDSQQQKRAHDE